MPLKLKRHPNICHFPYHSFLLTIHGNWCKLVYCTNLLSEKTTMFRTERLFKKAWGRDQRACAWFQQTPSPLWHFFTKFKTLSIYFLSNISYITGEFMHNWLHDTSSSISNITFYSVLIIMPLPSAQIIFPSHFWDFLKSSQHSIRYQGVKLQKSLPDSIKDCRFL